MYLKAVEKMFSSLFQTNPLYFIAPMLILLAPDYPMGIYSLIKESI